MVTSLFDQGSCWATDSLSGLQAIGGGYYAVQSGQAGAYFNNLARSLSQAGTMPTRHLTEVERHGESLRKSISEFGYLIGKEIE